MFTLFNWDHDTNTYSNLRRFDSWDEGEKVLRAEWDREQNAQDAINSYDDERVARSYNFVQEEVCGNVDRVMMGCVHADQGDPVEWYLVEHGYRYIVLEACDDHDGTTEAEIIDQSDYADDARDVVRRRITSWLESCSYSGSAKLDGYTGTWSDDVYDINWAIIDTNEAIDHGYEWGTWGWLRKKLEDADEKFLERNIDACAKDDGDWYTLTFDGLMYDEDDNMSALRFEATKREITWPTHREELERAKYNGVAWLALAGYWDGDDDTFIPGKSEFFPSLHEALNITDDPIQVADWMGRLPIATETPAIKVNRTVFYDGRDSCTYEHAYCKWNREDIYWDLEEIREKWPTETV